MSDEQTPLDVSFPRRDFLSGSFEAVDLPATLRVWRKTFLAGNLFAGVSPVLVREFSGFMAYQIAATDAERVQYLLTSNHKPALYVFRRGLMLLSVQFSIIDAQRNDGTAQRSGFTQQEYAELRRLFVQELRASAATRLNYEVSLDVKGRRYYGAMLELNDGFAADADWLGVASFEFLVTSLVDISLPERFDQFAGVSQELAQSRNPTSLELPAALRRAPDLREIAQRARSGALS